MEFSYGVKKSVIARNVKRLVEEVGYTWHKNAKGPGGTWRLERLFPRDVAVSVAQAFAEGVAKRLRMKPLIWLLFGLLSLPTSNALAFCHNLPEPTGQLLQAEPLGFSGLFVQVWDLGDGKRLLHISRLLPNEPESEEYLVDSHPLFYILQVPGKMDEMWVDQGGDLYAKPNGKCEEIVRYK